MEKIENEKLYRIILGIFSTISIIIIIIFGIFCFGLSKVNASSFDKNLYWDSPTWIQYYSNEPYATNGSTSAGATMLGSCNKLPYCLAPDGFPMYALIGYNVVDNSTDSTITAFQNGDKFKFRVKLDYMLKSNAINHKANFDFKITSGSTVYNAYCDSGEKLYINYVEQDERYEIDYQCDVFNVDRPIRYFMFQLYTPDDLFYSVGVLENFSVVVTPLDAGDIIENQNENTDKIIGAIDGIWDNIQGPGLDNTNPVDGTNAEDLEELEKELLDGNIINGLTEIDIAIDNNSNNFIWNLVTRIISTHTLLFGFIFTMLSLGVVKLILNR